MLSTRYSHQDKRHRLKVWEKIFYSNGNKRSGVAIMSDKTDFKTNKKKSGKEERGVIKD